MTRMMGWGDMTSGAGTKEFSQEMVSKVQDGAAGSFAIL